MKQDFSFIKMAKGKDAGVKPIKVTYYIAPDALTKLDIGVGQIREITGRRGEISKSLTVETCLRIAMNDLNERGQDSDIVQALSTLLKQ